MGTYNQTGLAYNTKYVTYNGFSTQQIPIPQKGGGGSSEGYKGGRVGRSQLSKLYSDYDVIRKKKLLEEEIALIEAEESRKEKEKLKREAAVEAEKLYKEADLKPADSKLFKAYKKDNGIDFAKFSRKIGNLKELVRLVEKRIIEKQEDEITEILLLSI